MTARHIPVCWHLNGCLWKTLGAGGAVEVVAHLANKGQGIHGSHSCWPFLFFGPFKFMLGGWPHRNVSRRITSRYPETLVPSVQELNSPWLWPLTVILTLRIWRHWIGSVSTHVMSRITSAITRAATNPRSCRSLIICKRVKVIILLSSLSPWHKD